MISINLFLVVQLSMILNVNSLNYDDSLAKTSGPEITIGFSSASLKVHLPVTFDSGAFESSRAIISVPRIKKFVATLTDRFMNHQQFHIFHMM